MESDRVCKRTGRLFQSLHEISSSLARDTSLPAHFFCPRTVVISSTLRQYLSSITWQHFKATSSSRASVLCVVLQHHVAANLLGLAYRGNKSKLPSSVSYEEKHFPIPLPTMLLLPRYARNGLFFSSKYGMLFLCPISEQSSCMCRPRRQLPIVCRSSV